MSIFLFLFRLIIKQKLTRQEKREIIKNLKQKKQDYINKRDGL
jgi:hypothetical protein